MFYKLKINTVRLQEICECYVFVFVFKIYLGTL